MQELEGKYPVRRTWRKLLRKNLRQFGHQQKTPTPEGKPNPNRLNRATKHWLRCQRELWTRTARGTMSYLIARFMGPSWGPSGADRSQVGPMLALWTLLSEIIHRLPEKHDTAYTSQGETRNKEEPQAQDLIKTVMERDMLEAICKFDMLEKAVKVKTSPLLITCKDGATKDTFMEHLKQLKGSSYETISIQQDLTKAQREEFHQRPKPHRKKRGRLVVISSLFVPSGSWSKTSDKASSPSNLTTELAIDCCCANALRPTSGRRMSILTKMACPVYTYRMVGHP